MTDQQHHDRDNTIRYNVRTGLPTTLIQQAEGWLILSPDTIPGTAHYQEQREQKGLPPSLSKRIIQQAGELIEVNLRQECHARVPECTMHNPLWRVVYRIAGFRSKEEHPKTDLTVVLARRREPEYMRHHLELVTGWWNRADDIPKLVSKGSQGAYQVPAAQHPH